jgi:glycosyltransferase involved in cell wall biosynthesis
VLGRLHAVKRPIWIAQAVRRLASSFRESASEVVFVGAGPEASALAEFVRRHALQDVITLVGEVDDPSEALASADVLVQGSRMEGLPLSIVEAKRMGLRVVTTPAGGSGEILDEQDIMTTTFESSEFESALRREILRGPQSMADRQAVQRAYSDFTQEASSIQFYEILRDRFGSKRISEFVTGPIEGGIPSTIRARLTHATTPPLTEVIAPFVKTSEALAAPETLPCEVLVCSPGLTGLQQMVTQLRLQRPQVVIAHGERELLYASWAKRRARNNSRLVFLIHNDRIESRTVVRPLSMMITGILARHVDVALAVSGIAAHGELGRLFAEPIVTIQPPRHPNSREPIAITGGYRFTSAGRMVPRKGFDVLLSAISVHAKSFIDSGSQVVIAGDGPSLNDLQDQAVALGIDRFVDFPGSIPQLADELRASHYFLQPSESEGAGMALLEALQCGARAASGPVGIAPEALALDPRNTLFKTVPTKSDWIQWFTDTFAIQPPTLDERIARARTYQTAYDSTVLADRFYQVIFGGN